MITDIKDFSPELIGKENMFFNCDCMELMKNMPDKAVQLAIVDPPYGLNICKHKSGTVQIVGGRPFGGYHGIRKEQERIIDSNFYPAFDDSSAPDAQYFKELKRVSENQIIWGGNFFLDDLEKATCMIVWDKKRRGLTQADCEIAWTSLKGQSRIFEFKWNGMLQEDMKHKEKRIHPTQKPVKLYEWLLAKFAKPDDTMLDTHVGSASSLIACHNTHHKYIGCEANQAFYEPALARLKAAEAQMNIYDLMGD